MRKESTKKMAAQSLREKLAKFQGVYGVDFNIEGLFTVVDGQINHFPWDNFRLQDLREFLRRENVIGDGIVVGKVTETQMGLIIEDHFLECYGIQVGGENLIETPRGSLGIEMPRSGITRRRV